MASYLRDHDLEDVLLGRTLDAPHISPDNTRITAAIKRDDYQGLRVTPNVYTTLDEVDTFAGAIEDLLKNGAPSTAA